MSQENPRTVLDHGWTRPPRSSGMAQNSTVEPPAWRKVRPTGERTTMVDDPDHRMQQPHPRARPRRLLEAFSSPDSYGLVLLLIVASYTLSAATTPACALSLVLFVQIATIWTTLQASQARRRLREGTTAVLVISAAIAILNLFLPRQPTG